MGKKMLTWVDRLGMYRITSPAFDDPTQRHNSEWDMVALAWAECRNIYDLPEDHPFFVVEDVDFLDRLAEIGEEYFRSVARPNAEGKRSRRLGAWRMDVDGRPKVDMPIARDIRAEDALMALEERAEIPDRAAIVQAFKAVLMQKDTPLELLAAWPAELM